MLRSGSKEPKESGNLLSEMGLFNFFYRMHFFYSHFSSKSVHLSTYEN